MTPVIFSTSEEYFAAARQELSTVFPRSKIARLGPELGSVGADTLDIGDIAEACRAQPLVFPRHLMREMARIPLAAGPETVEAVYGTVRQLAMRHLAGHTFAFQVWATELSPANNQLVQAIVHQVIDGLAQQGVEVARAGQAHVLSVCVAPALVIIGLNRQSDALADWPGGRVHLAKRDSQISRSEFKLEEASKVFGLMLPSQGNALDLGASPGGWTRILRQGGLDVWAVDPGDLDPRVAADPRVRHVKTTAGAFLAQNDLLFDLLVNDMRIDTRQSCEIMLSAARHLKPAGLAVLMLKLTPHRPVETVRACLDILRRSYEVLHARQLFHNRNEVTVVARRR
jgi:23S rRNA (cytidine2498-2'-O)-methyltransferase